jgi:transcriptional regulator of heat shock response
LVHDFRQDRKQLFDKLNQQIEQLEVYKQQNQHLDAVYLDREFSHLSRRIDSLSTDLEEFRTALFDESLCGLSVKELYLTSYPNGAHINLRKEFKYFHFTVNVSEFLRKLRDYERNAEHTQSDAHSWKERVSFAHFTRTDLEHLLSLLEGISLFQEQLSEKLEGYLGEILTLTEALDLLNARKSWLQLLSTLQNEAQWELFVGRLRKSAFERKESEWFDKKEKQVLRCFEGPGPEESLPTAKLALTKELVSEALFSSESPLKWQTWKWFSKDRVQVQNLLAQHKLPLETAGLRTMLEMLENRIALEELLKEMRQAGEVARSFDKLYLKHWFDNHRQALKARKACKKLKHFYPDMPLLDEDLFRFEQRVYKLFSLLEEAQGHYKSWQKYLTHNQIQLLLEERAPIAQWKKSLEEDFELLVETDRTYKEMSAVEAKVCDKLWEKKQDQPMLSLASLFDNSLRLAWIEHIEERYPLPQSVSTRKFSRMEEELRELVKQKTALSRHILLMRLRENVYRALELNRLGNQVTYRDLRHQLTKKRSLWPIRKVLQSFSQDVFRLTPCWMASPETVSACFPLPDPQVQPFDLVIFDEASQCFAEKGLPAMFRGKQVVVTGDSQQLPPSDLYQVRFEEDNPDELPELEIESLLDLSARYFSQHQLLGHYRSQSPELIDFSNQYFYRQTLRLLPDRLTMNSPEPALRYIKVEGVWEDQCNLPEAEAVSQLVWQLLKELPGREIGVVTFNFRQQQLIQDLLEEKALQEQRQLPSWLFVKNIENVQGDERDVIVFSIGYAPDKKGRLSLQFGSLNQQGGENRLNVAITRARERVYVLSSLLPHELHTEQTAHEGPKLLTRYLAYAFEVSRKHYQPQPLPQRTLAGQNLLKHKLSLLDNRLQELLPFADLTLQQDKQYQKLLLTDDDLYHQSLSAKDAHVYQPQLLEAKHWPWLRIFSRQLWKGKTLELIREL